MCFGDRQRGQRCAHRDRSKVALLIFTTVNMLQNARMTDFVNFPAVSMLPIMTAKGRKRRATASLRGNETEVRFINNRAGELTPAVPTTRASDAALSANAKSAEVRRRSLVLPQPFKLQPNPFETTLLQLVSIRRSCSVAWTWRDLSPSSPRQTKAGSHSSDSTFDEVCHFGCQVLNPLSMAGHVEIVRL